MNPNHQFAGAPESAPVGEDEKVLQTPPEATTSQALPPAVEPPAEVQLPAAASNIEQNVQPIVPTPNKSTQIQPLSPEQKTKTVENWENADINNLNMAKQATEELARLQEG